MEHRVDRTLLLTTAAILVASLLTLASLQGVVAGGLFVRQGVWGALGLVLMMIVARIHVEILLRLAPIVYGIGMLMLVAVLFVGVERSGTKGWFALGPLSLQPAELARLAAILLVGWYMERTDERHLRFGSVIALALIVGAPMALIAIQPDLGVALTYLPVMIAAFWVGGLRLRWWVAFALVGMIVAGAAWQWGLKEYQKERILTTIDAERDPYGAGYQVRQSKIAIGSGQLTGRGIGEGTQSQLRFLPAQETDFIFAVWAEATGLIGSLALVIAYALLVIRIGAVAMAAQERQAMVLVAAVGAWISFQLVINLGMVVGWLPTTGITLPLFSYGGSSILTTCLALGVVQSVWSTRLVNL